MTKQRGNAMENRERTSMFLAVIAGLASACASSPPRELVDARAAFERAQTVSAGRQPSAELQLARIALDGAEKSFDKDGDSPQTKTRAYVALRKAQIAAVEAQLSENERRLSALERDALERQNRELVALRGRVASDEQGSEAERQARAAASELASVGSVKQEPRGVIVTLSGGMLFASGKADLLPSARDELRTIAKALNERAPNSNVIIEGHTDSRGDEELNLLLSTNRAEAVRNFLASQGVAEERIRVEGLGFSRPIASNGTAKGRASNRRVEIVLQPNARTSAR